MALDGSVGHDGSYALSWSSVTGMASYTIEELALSDPANACPDSSVDAVWAGAGFSSTPSLTAERHTLAGKNGGEAFCYRVRAVALNDAVSAWSGSFKVEVPVLGVPYSEDRRRRIRWGP